MQLAAMMRKMPAGILVLTKKDLTDRIVQTIMYLYAHSTLGPSFEGSFPEIQRNLGFIGGKTGGENHSGEEDFSGCGLPGG